MYYKLLSNATQICNKCVSISVLTNYVLNLHTRYMKIPSLKYKFIRYIEFDFLFEIFFLSSIAAILGIRCFLFLSGYPQLGGGGIHIAHMLWGGVFLLFSVLGLMAYLNDELKPFWAFLGGIGFGTFIDELGKFITSDNNYFYQPTFAIIYIVFICLYVLFKTVEKNSKFSKDEYLINSLDKLKEVIINDLDREEQEEALMYLRKSDTRSPLVAFLKKTFEDIESIPEEKVGLYTQMKHKLSAFYLFLVKKRWFLQLIIVFFVLRAGWYVLEGAFVVFAIVVTFMSENSYAILQPRGIFSIIDVFAVVIQAVFVVLGVFAIRKNRIQAYVYFKNAVIISIIVIQIFNFYRNPVEAFFFTIGDLLLISVLNYMLVQERKKKSSSI